MKRKTEILFMVLFSLLLSACDRPPISQEKMEDILFDIYRTDAYLTSQPSSASAEKRVKLYDSVFEKHGVTKDEFDEALDWYAHHTKAWQLIHGNLETRVNEFVERVENYEFTPQEKPAVQDSIDTLDLWVPKRQWKWQEDDGEFDKRQIDYTLDDRKFFVGAKCLKFRMNMRCWSTHENDSNTSMMVIRYSKGPDDTLRYKAPVDSVERIYVFTKKIPSNTSVSAVRVQLIDSVDGLKGVTVSGAKLEYAFNRHKESISRTSEAQLQNLRRELRDGSDVPESSPMLLRKSVKMQVPARNRRR